MEVDELGGCNNSGGADPENQLVNMFSSMATEDKDNLVTALQAVVGSGVSPSSCRFFLELANWNLSAAIGAYYDFDFSQQQQHQQQEEAVRDSVYPTGSSIPRLAILSFEASPAVGEPAGCAAAALTCTIYNESTQDCPPDCSLVCFAAPSASASVGASADATASGDAPALCEPCRLPSLRAGGNCRCRLLLPRLPAAGASVRLRLLAPDGSLLTSPAAIRCVDLAAAGPSDCSVEEDADAADAAAAAAAASWAICEPPLAENPPPSPCHDEEQMME